MRSEQFLERLQDLVAEAHASGLSLEHIETELATVLDLVKTQQEEEKT
jgi:hypothetical protein